MIYLSGFTKAMRMFLISLAIMCFSSTVFADNSAAGVLSDLTGPLILAVEMGLYFNGHDGRQEAVNGVKALVATGVVTETLKLTVREKRLESNSTDSFPSAHTAGAFAMAAVIGNYRPDYEWPSYALAAAIGWSRVEGREHRWRDVIAGALIGYVIADKFTDKPAGVAPNVAGCRINW